MKVQSYIIRTMQLSVRIVLNLLLVNRVSDLVVSLWPVRNFIFGFEQNERRAPAAHLQIDNSWNNSFPHGYFHHQFETIDLCGIETLIAVSVVLLLAKVRLEITLGSFP
jgi:hypothetical protein